MKNKNDSFYTKKQIFKPCSKCLYRLGIVKTFISPCPMCKRNKYSAYKTFIKQTDRIEDDDIFEDFRKEE